MSKTFSLDEISTHKSPRYAPPQSWHEHMQLQLTPACPAAHVGSSLTTRSTTLQSSYRCVCSPPASCTPYHAAATTQDHPGGAKIILKYGGKDATSAYEPIHPPDALDKHLPREKHLGTLDSAAATTVKEAAQNRKKTQDELRVEAARTALLPLSRMLSLWDIEVREALAETQILFRLPCTGSRKRRARFCPTKHGRTTLLRRTRSLVRFPFSLLLSCPG